MVQQNRDFPPGVREPAMQNKAHTATLNRIAQRYGVAPSPGAHDIETDDFIIEVETSASIDDAVALLRDQSVAVYIAVTNKEGVALAVQRVESTMIGVMDPQGNVIRASGNHAPPEAAN